MNILNYMPWLFIFGTSIYIYFITGDATYITTFGMGSIIGGLIVWLMWQYMNKKR